MKKSHNFKALMLMLCCLISMYSYAQTEAPEYVPGQVLIKLKANRTTVQKNALKNQLNASLRRSRPNSRTEVWDIDQNQNPTDIRQVVAQYRNHPDIEYIEPNYYYYLTMDDYLEEASSPPITTHPTPSPANRWAIFQQAEKLINWLSTPFLSQGCEGFSRGLKERKQKSRGWVELSTTPNDALYPDQWSLYNTGQSNGTPDADIDAPDSDSYRKGHKNVNFIPNDTEFSDQWGMRNTGQNGGTPDADIDALGAWDIATGSPSIVVGLIDTGIDWKHPDLVNNIWQNLGEDADGDGQVLEWNGSTWIFDPGDINDIDDDGNGYADDFIGWDFIDNDNNPFDVLGHGTHVAGTIGAEGNNGIGVAGVTWDVQIAALRVFAQQSTPIDVITEALDYAVLMDMPISNNSYAEGRYSSLMTEALTNAEANSHLFVAAAGNFRNDNDDNPNYPSSYPFDNVISVAATDPDDLLWIQSPNRGSNYGASNVDIAAPGRRIKSTVPQNNYFYNTGTSMATPHVTGACALLWEQSPNKTYAEIKNAVLSSVDVLPDLSERSVSEGRLNLYGALTYFEENTTAPLSCMERDSLALVALYEATDGANWTNTWDLSQPIDEWYGIVLDGDGCVSMLFLDDNELSGSIPLELGNLSNLTFLNLSSNELSGSIPSELGNLSNLTLLWLSYNQLSGSIPPELGNLNSLTSLLLSYNQLSGSIPPEFGNLNSLTSLSFYSNQLSGSIPVEVCDLSSLTSLELSYNQLSGSILPELGNLNNLTSLRLSGNQLSGSIPLEIGNLNSLTTLFLSSNQLSGSVPSEIGSLSNLTNLFLYSNQLSGCYDENLISLCSQLGTIYNRNTSISNGNNFNASWEDFCDTGAGTCPPINTNCRYIDSLALVALYNATDGANWDASAIWDLTQPMNTWHGVTLSGDGCVTIIVLNNTGLSGSIPPEMGNLTNLTSLNLTRNDLSGNIPGEMGNLTNLTDLRLSTTQLSGSIPSEMGNLTNLTLLMLYDNQLSGSIPTEIGNMNNLTTLSLLGNQLSGNIPAEMGNLTNLTWLRLENNQLTSCYDGNLMSLCGQLSSNINNTHISDGNNFDAPWEDFCNSGAGTCSSCRQSDSLALVALYDSTNGADWTNTWDLNQSLNTWYGVALNGFGCVASLSLYNNNLSGSIPSDLGNLSNLNFLNFFNNDLSGSIPPDLGNLSNLTRLYLSNNQLSGCYDENLMSICSQLDSAYNRNIYLSNGNNFDAPWEDFCNNGAGICTDPVWPGDYNYDGIANETDALYWGLAYGNTGDIRPNASTTWQGQQATNWSEVVEGINGKHQDGNGDGIVDGADLQVLDNNFGNIHAYTQSVYIASSMVYRLEEAGPVSGNPSYDLYVSDANGNDISAHGLAGVIDFGNWQIDEITLKVDNSSLEPSDTLKDFDPVENRFHFALTRTDDFNKVCIGPVANFIIVTEDIPVGDSIKIDIENGTTIQANGDMANIAGTTFYAHDPGGIANNSLVVGASVLHEQCTMPGSISLNVEGGNAPYSYVWNTGAISSNLSNLTPGIYELTVTDAYGATETLSVEVQGQYISMPDAFGNFPDCINAPCPTLIAPNGTIPAGTYKAATAVNSTGSINGNVDFKAGEIIILRPGFEAPSDKEFSGTIEDCGGN